jgi:hypothetical protein
MKNRLLILILSSLHFIAIGQQLTPNHKLIFNDPALLKIVDAGNNEIFVFGDYDNVGNEHLGVLTKLAKICCASLVLRTRSNT